jgi:hypothetical protein
MSERADFAVVAATALDRRRPGRKARGVGAEHQEQRAAAAPSPATAATAATAVPVSAALRRGASNRAVTALIARQAQTATPAPERPDLRATEAAMVAARTAARARAARLNQLADESVEALQAAERNLRLGAATYREAHGRLTAKLTEADERFATEQAVKDAVQGILVAGALALIGPELLIVGGGTALVEAAAATTAREIARAGVGGALGEVAEMGGGAVASGARGPAVAPSATAAGAGPTSGDRYEEAFGKLGDMISAMPRLGRAATVSMDVALLAGEVETEAVRLGAGGTGPRTPAQVQERRATVEAGNAREQGSLAPAEDAAARVRVLSAQITSTPSRTADDVERLLWTTWMAALQGSANEVLDNDVIQRYLTAKGLLTPGDWMSDADQADAVVGARREVLRQRGIDVEAPGAAIDSLYRREMKLDGLRRRLLGKPGRIARRDRVLVDGGEFDAPGQFGVEAGADVIVTHLVVKPYRQGLTINAAEWRDDDFDVMGVRAGDPQGP